MRTGFRPAIGLILSVLLSGCQSIAYYSQAVEGQFGIWALQRDIDRVMRDPDVKDDIKTRIESARKARRFASEVLMLPDNESYSRYADIGRRYVIWSVVATPKYSIDPVKSCFFIVGCVSYRGYYEKTAAISYARQSEQAGLDVYLGGVTAYSTLGWFDDPLLSSMLARSDAAIAALIFHELAHQVIFVKGDTLFNESFATAVERIGLRQWADFQPDSPALKAYFSVQRKHEMVIDLILKARKQLARVYLENADQGAERRAEQKQAQFKLLKLRYSELKSREGGSPSFDRFFEAELNNASLALFSDYNARVDEFERLFDASGGDWKKFYIAVKKLGKVRPKKQD